MFLGLDNTSMLPPFFPFCRNQDSVFAGTLRAVSEHAYVAHLPFVLGHTPEKQRTYAPNRDSIVRMSDVVLRTIWTWRPAVDSRTWPERLMDLGRYVSSVASLPPQEFSDFVVWLMCARLASVIETLEHTLLNARFASGAWTSDLEQRIEQLRRVPSAADYAVPVDVAGATAQERGCNAQRALRSFGELLSYWPAILDRTIMLRENGISLAQCVSSPHQIEQGYAV